MSSGDLSAQEVNDLLQRLTTESIKVFASFEAKVSGVTCSLVGLVNVFPDGRVRIGTGIPREPLMVFRLSVTSVCRYADSRALKDRPDKAEFFKANFAAVLTFRFEDGSVLSLFEVAERE
jgi:hypothetical protein